MTFYRQDTAFYHKNIHTGLNCRHNPIVYVIFAAQLFLNAKTIRQSVQIFYHLHPYSDLAWIVYDSLH